MPTAVRAAATSRVIATSSSEGCGNGAVDPTAGIAWLLQYYGVGAGTISGGAEAVPRADVSSQYEKELTMIIDNGERRYFLVLSRSLLNLPCTDGDGLV